MVFDVKYEDKNKRLDLFLLEKIEGKTRSFIKNLLDMLKGIDPNDTWKKGQDR